MYSGIYQVAYIVPPVNNTVLCATIKKKFVKKAELMLSVLTTVKNKCQCFYERRSLTFLLQKKCVAM